MSSSQTQILFVVAHPQLERSRANRAITEAVARLPGVRVHNLYDQYPYFHVNVPAEQALLLDHQTVVMQHPLYWYSMPPLMKLWLDEVFASGWAYGPGGDKLKGKNFLVSVTAGGPRHSYAPDGYNRFAMEALLAPWDQTAHLCKMNWLKPHVLYNSIRGSQEELDAHTRTLCERLEAIDKGAS